MPLTCLLRAREVRTSRLRRLRRGVDVWGREDHGELDGVLGALSTEDGGVEALVVDTDEDEKDEGEDMDEEGDMEDRGESLSSGSVKVMFASDS